jgi:hypothetical protein
MPTVDRTPEDFPSEAQLLAAIERAGIHRGRPHEPGVLFGAVIDHLGLPRGSWTTRHVRPKFDAAEAAGLIEHARRHSSTLWKLTSSGHEWLQMIRASGEIVLPESPQHRTWRKARAAAGERIAGFRADIRGTLDEAIDLLEAGHEANSATWFDLSERLHDASKRLATATHCQREWQEPDDSTADIDDAPYGENGRRYTQAWGSDSPI